MREHPDNALLHYNLACYWSLAGNNAKALDELSLAASSSIRTFGH